MYIHICLYLCIYVYVYIYIYIEIERDTHIMTQHMLSAAHDITDNAGTVLLAKLLTWLVRYVLMLTCRHST